MTHSCVKRVARSVPLALFLSLSLSLPASADSFPADDHAPIGVMAEHQHLEGEWMLSYRYGRMDMQGNRDGTSGVSRQQVLQNFMVAPLSMTMEMHMFGLMYGWNDTVTLMGMVPYLDKEMEHVNRMNRRFSTHTDGVGDVKASAMISLYDQTEGEQRDRVHLNAGFSLPTGSIDERGDTPAGANQVLPYPMQLGSGTVDPILSLTAYRNGGVWSYGVQAGGTFRFAENSEDYRLGNEYQATAWLARNLSRYVSVSGRLEGRSWGDIHGRDARLNPAMVPTARTDLRGGERVDALLGVNLYMPEGYLEGHRLALEAGAPVYQHLDGPQLETDWRFMLGWQKSF